MRSVTRYYGARYRGPLTKSETGLKFYSSWRGLNSQPCYSLSGRPKNLCGGSCLGIFRPLCSPVSSHCNSLNIPFSLCHNAYQFEGHAKFEIVLLPRCRATCPFWWHTCFVGNGGMHVLGCHYRSWPHSVVRILHSRCGLERGGCGLLCQFCCRHHWVSRPITSRRPENPKIHASSFM